MGREIRRVPANWQHPKQGSNYRPLLSDFESHYSDWKEELKTWRKERDEFKNGKSFSYDGVVYSKANGNTYEDWAGEEPERPRKSDFMPKGKWWQAFENVSEGTPITPPFATKEELKKWMCENRDFWGRSWPAEAVEKFVKDLWAPSGIMAGGKFYRPEEQYLLES